MLANWHQLFWCTHATSIDIASNVVLIPSTACERAHLKIGAGKQPKSMNERKMESLENHCFYVGSSTYSHCILASFPSLPAAIECWMSERAGGRASFCQAVGMGSPSGRKLTQKTCKKNATTRRLCICLPTIGIVRLIMRLN